MTSKANEAARSRRSHRAPKRQSQDRAFHPGAWFPKYSKKNKNRNRWPSLEDRFGSFQTREELAERIAKSYEKEEANE